MNRKQFLQMSGWLLPLPFIGCVPQKEQQSAEKSSDTAQTDKFTFAFLTDVHLYPDNPGDGDNGMRKAMADAKSRGIDFILFGGDNVTTNFMKAEEAELAEKMHAHFRNIVDEAAIECHFTMGNHDRYYFRDGKEDIYGTQLFEKYFGPAHTTFDHKGVHFIILNSTDGSLEEYQIGKEQLEWLRQDLEKTGKETPIVISLHVPMLSLYYPVVEGNFKPYDMIANTKQVVDMLKGYNIQVVLQGHQHIHEELRERGHWFVTGGAVCANWWRGELVDTEEGYLLVHVHNDNTFSWEYIDYGWEAQLKPEEK